MAIITEADHGNALLTERFTEDGEEIVRYRGISLYHRHIIFDLDISFPTEDYARAERGYIDNEYAMSIFAEPQTDKLGIKLVAHSEDEGEYDECRFSMRVLLDDLIDELKDNPELVERLESKFRNAMRESHK